MDWVKSIAAIFALVVTFFAGATYEKALKNEEIAQIRKEYAEASQAAQNSIVEEFNAKQKELEKTLADARARESDARAESQRLQQRINSLKRNAKSPESRFAVRSLEALRRCQAIVSRDSTIIEYCRKALP